jgi:hypothetical protein
MKNPMGGMALLAGGLPVHLEDGLNERDGDGQFRPLSLRPFSGQGQRVDHRLPEQPPVDPELPGDPANRPDPELVLPT